MPYKDKEKQKKAVREAQAKLRRELKELRSKVANAQGENKQCQ